MSNKPFSDEVIFSIFPKEIFPLWFSDVSDFEVVKNHSRIVYGVRANGGCYYLKIAPESKAEDGWSPNKEKLVLSSDFARHLSDMGAPVARPVVSKQDRYVEEHTFSDVDMVIQVAAEVPGVTVSETCTDLNVYRRCGIALATLHSAAESSPQRSKYDDNAWENYWIETGQKIPENHETLLAEYKRIDTWLNDSCPLPGGKGLTHGDTNILNFIDDKNRVSIIDVDNPEFTWYAVDMSHPFRHRNEDISHEERFDLWSAFYSGYCSVRAIDLDYEMITWLLRLWSLDTYVMYMPYGVKKEWMKRLLRFIENPSKW
ncbi:MAG: phosphotransferase [Candidatus Latescibacterota bacterium]